MPTIGNGSSRFAQSTILRPSELPRTLRWCFPAVLPLRATEAHIARVAGLTEPIRFVLRRAAVVPDAHGVRGPCVSPSRRMAVTLSVACMNGSMQDGRAAAEWKQGASFTPHVTVAAGATSDPLHSLAGDLNARGSRHPRINLGDRAGRRDAGRDQARRALPTRDPLHNHLQTHYALPVKFTHF